MNRPHYKGCTVTTPEAFLSLGLLGMKTYKDIGFTSDQFRAINNLYGLVPEKSNSKPKPPDPPIRSDFRMEYEYKDAVIAYEREFKRWVDWEDPRTLLQAGADRNALRHAESDGLRIIAWLAKYVPAGEDPLKFVIQLAASSGMDVNFEDITWAESLDE